MLSIRKDLEFFPYQQGNKKFILIKDHLGLVGEGKAVPLTLFQFMSLLDGSSDIRDLQMKLIRQSGGLLVDIDQVKRIIHELDCSYLLESERFYNARDKIINEFVSKDIRPCSHCGLAYPIDPLSLKKRLDEILNLNSKTTAIEKHAVALIAPHIDMSVGEQVYASAYSSIKHQRPSRVIILGVGHYLTDGLFSVTSKDFETPLGIVKTDKEAVGILNDAGGSVFSKNDFVHKSEHSIEFQIIFLQHLMPQNSFKIIPILCGGVQSHLSGYTRKAYLDKVGGFLKALRDIRDQDEHQTLVVVGIDLSHIGPKFGHQTPATYIESRSKAHDQRILESVTRLDADGLWEESGRIKDQFNLCGFSALACMMEILPPCKGQIIDYKIWHESPTNSAVSFAAAIFTPLERPDAESSG